MKGTKILLTVLTTFVMSSSVYAAIPDSVIIGNKAYAIKYIFNKANYTQVNTDLENYSNEIYYKLNSKIYKLSNNESLTD